jgi:dynein heavy chain
MQFFYNRVKANLHMAICMSPFDETFRYIDKTFSYDIKLDLIRNSIRMYPALVNCTTVIYFSEWPPEALIDVAHYFLTKFNFRSENNETVMIFLKLLNILVILLLT